MKKLRIALTFLLVLCCSVCLFACKKTGDNGGAKNVSEMSITGGKRSFKEGEAFSAGDDLKVKVYYQGDDNEYELTSEDYEIDSSAYNKDKAGTYNIYIIPKNQPENLWDGQEGSADNRFKKSYPVSVDHSWTEGEPGKYTCACGAVRNSYPELNDQFKFVGWGNVGEYTRGAEGKTYPDAKAPIAGENHISYGSLVAGQSLELVLKLSALNRPTSLVYNESTGGINGVEMYDTPLMGFRNGAVGFIPREDNYVIGTAAGFVAAAGSNIPSGNGAPTGGTATTESNLWDFYCELNPAIINASTDFVDSTLENWSTVVVTYDYQSDGIMRISHELYRFKDYDPDAEPDTTITYTVKVPDAAYEVVVYGENCSFTITSAEFIAGRALKENGLTIPHGPDAVYQPAGKLFDTTGLETRAEFTDGGVIEDSYNAYAYRDITPDPTDEVPDPQPVKTKINLSTDVLTADMYDFCVEFNGQTAWLTKDGQESTADNKTTNQTITVVPNVITGATTTPIKSGEVTYDAPAVEYDYAVTKSHDYIRLVATGTAMKATAAQSEKLGGSTHFIAFKLLTNLTADGIADTLSATGTNISVIAKKVGTTVDVIVGVKADYAKTFDLTLKDETKIQIDLSGLEELPAVGAEITQSDFYLDIGGTYTVKYSGFSGSADALKLSIGSKTETVANIKEAIKGEYAEGVTPDRDTFFRGNDSQYIVGIDDTDGLTVTYWLAAPQIGNLTVNQIAPEVTLRDADNKVLASATLTYRLLVKSATNIGTDDEPVYVVPSDNRLIVYAVKESENLENGLGFAATLNIEHTKQAAEEYLTLLFNVGVTVADGAATWADENLLTKASTAKVIPFGTMNDATDYDTGAILIANLSLTALGVRADDTTAQFRFTANENTEEGQETYTIYSVTENTITSTEKTPDTERVNVHTGSCVADDVKAYQDGDFYYGALIKYATGAHTFQGYAEGSTTDTCKVCGAVITKVVEGSTTYEYTVLDEKNMATFTNRLTTDAAAWWDVNQKIGVRDLGEGDFVITYAWDQVDANYASDGAITLSGTKTEGSDLRKRFLEPATDEGFKALEVGKGLIGEGGTINYKLFDKDGAEVTYNEDFAALEDGRWLGNYKVTAVRLGTTLYVYEKVVTSDRTFTSELVITKFTTEALTVCLWGSPAWCGETVKCDIGTVKTTTTGITDMVIGAEDCSAAYTADTPLWTMGFTAGMKVTVKGKHNSAGAGAYTTALAYLYGLNDEGERAAGGTNFRMDYWVNGADEGDNQNEKQPCNVAAYNFSIMKGVWFDDTNQSSDWFGNYSKLYVGKDLDVTITWDWTKKSQIVISYTMVGKIEGADAVFHMDYTIKAMSGNLPTNLEIGLGTDHACYKVTEMSVLK